MAKQKLYTWRSVEKFIQNMSEKGWDCIQLNEGSLGIGDWVLIAPTENKWNYVIREKYVDMYSSAQTVRKCRKLSQKVLKEIEKVEEDK